MPKKSSLIINSWYSVSVIGVNWNKCLGPKISFFEE